MSSARDRITGLDPYDALRGSRVPTFVKAHRRLRQTLIQVRKRVPLDLAPILGIPPFPMAKSAGCQLSACARRTAAGDASASLEGRDLLEALLGDSRLASAESGGFGYEFDVQTRWSYYPAGMPNVIATYFVGRGLLEYYMAAGDSAAGEAALRAAHFVASDLVSPRGHVRYTQTSDTLIHNANALGSGLMAACGWVMGDERLVSLARTTIQPTVEALSDSAVWPYGEDDTLGWVDNFHTAYTLDGLTLVWLATGDPGLCGSLERAADRWQTSFFGTDGAPHYYADGSGPLDVHSGATAVDVGCRLGDLGVVSPELAPLVALWMRRHLVAEDDVTTRYRLHRGWVDRRHFVRWGDAHWALARSSLALRNASRLPILESALRSGQ